MHYLNIFRRSKFWACFFISESYFSKVEDHPHTWKTTFLIYWRTTDKDNIYVTYCPSMKTHIANSFKKLMPRKTTFPQNRLVLMVSIFASSFAWSWFYKCFNVNLCKSLIKSYSKPLGEENWKCQSIHTCAHTTTGADNYHSSPRIRFIKPYWPDFQCWNPEGLRQIWVSWVHCPPSLERGNSTISRSYLKIHLIILYMCNTSGPPKKSPA